ncbi:MAG: DNA repair protein RecO [Tissierellaceae bacterium]
MIKTRGIVLKEMRYKDTSKILRIFTRDYGKISVMARGAYRPRSQIIANTQPFSYNEYQFYRGKNFLYLNQADILDSFYSIRERMERVIYGQYILELVDKSMEIEMENIKIFDLFLKGLQVLSSLESGFMEFIVAYELKFISFLGYRPHLDGCVMCKEHVIDDFKFSIQEGGIICRECALSDPYKLNINIEMLGGMKELLFTPLEKVGDLDIDESNLNRLHSLIVDYILYNIDRKKFNTLKHIKIID